MPLISIIVPIYNVEEYLTDCIESILKQTFTDFELILVNDGSIDKSYDICLKYSNLDNRIKLVNKQNGGVSSARNKGIEISKGEYITFVDPDDTVDINMYEILYNTAEKYKSDIVICPIKSHNLAVNKVGISDIWGEANCVLDQKIISESFFPSFIESHIFTFLPCVNKIYRRSLFTNSNIKFEENKSHSEDIKINLKLLPLINSMIFVEQPFYNYYKRERDSLSRIFRDDLYNYILENKNLLLDTCDYYSLNELKDKVKNDFMNTTISYMNQIVDSNLNIDKKYTILSNILNDSNFENDILTWKCSSIYSKLLKKICIFKHKKLFYIVSKNRSYLGKMKRRIKPYNKIDQKII